MSFPRFRRRYECLVPNDERPHGIVDEKAVSGVAIHTCACSHGSSEYTNPYTFQPCDHVIQYSCILGNQICVQMCHRNLSQNTYIQYVHSFI